jgi:hypothetical protein
MENRRYAYRYRKDCAVDFPGGVRHATSRVVEMKRDIRIMLTMMVGSFEENITHLFPEVQKRLLMPFYGATSSNTSIKNGHNV